MAYTKIRQHHSTGLLTKMTLAISFVMAIPLISNAAVKQVKLRIVGNPSSGSYSVQATNVPVNASVNYYDNGTFIHVEHVKPYCLFGDNGQTCNLSHLAVGGSHTILVKVVNARGAFVSQADVSIQQGPVSPPPKPTPVPAPQPTPNPTPVPTPVPTPTATPVPSPSGFKALFPANSIWSADISNAQLDSESSSMIAWMVAGGNWGKNQLGWMPSGNLRLSQEMHVNYITSTTPYVPFMEMSGYYLPDCDNFSSYPLPVGGSIEDNGNLTHGYSNCGLSGADCHMFNVDLANHKLYETYQTSVVNNTVAAACGITWDLSNVYPASGRGDQCTSTDAAGLPTAAFLFSADDLVAGHIDHMLRLTLPNSRIRRGVYVHPATHASGPSGGASAPDPSPIYGSVFRLHASFDITPYPPGVQVILKALKKYGMIIADGGDLAISAESDYDTVHKYTETGLVDQYSDIAFINVADFDVVDGGARIPITDNCVRNGQ